MNKRLTRLRNDIPLYMMFIPGFALVFLFSYMPMFGTIIAFKQINMRDGIFGSPWVGLENFRMLMNNSNAWLALRNTVLYNLVFISTGVVFAVTLAVLLSLIKNKLASKVYQTIYIMPYFLSMVIIAYIVYAFLNMESGFLNNTAFVNLFGGEKVNWYTKTNAWPVILFIVNAWKTIGYSSIVYLAAMAGIDPGLYEAATIDGASTWKKIIHITLPSLKNIVIIMTIMDIGRIFSSDFGLFYNVPMDSGALYPTTMVMNTYVYNMMRGAGAAGSGLSAAASMLQSVLGFIMVVSANAVVRKIDRESAMF